MAENRGKPPGHPPAAPLDADSEAGRLAEDDRGNVTWQWAEDEELTADDDVGAFERVQALADPRMQIKDDDDSPNNPAQNNPKGLRTGYNPYNSGALGKQSWKKKKDLRQLSQWIELRKKMAKTSQDPEGGEGGGE